MAIGPHSEGDLIAYGVHLRQGYLYAKPGLENAAGAGFFVDAGGLTNLYEARD